MLLIVSTFLHFSLKDVVLQLFFKTINLLQLQFNQFAQLYHQFTTYPHIDRYIFVFIQETSVKLDYLTAIHDRHEEWLLEHLPSDPVALVYVVPLYFFCERGQYSHDI